MFGDIISAIGGWFSGERNRDAQRDINSQNVEAARANALITQEQNKYLRHFNANKINILTQDANRAGIHPLAALGSQVAGSFAQPMAPQMPAMGTPETGSAIGDGMSALGKIFSKNDPLETERKKLVNEGLRVDIDAKKAETTKILADATSRSLINTTQNNPTNLEIARTKNKLASGPYGIIDPDRAWSDAQDFENRYGELSDWVIGPQIAWADFYKNKVIPGSERFENRRARWHGEPLPFPNRERR